MYAGLFLLKIMAFDGVTIHALQCELNDRLIGGRIAKIAQPEKEELLLTIKNEGETHRLFLSANPSLPLVYLTMENKVSPMTAPNFCMLLRKHLQNGRITKIEQPGLERVLHISVEHLDEMGDLCTHILTAELMGKYSNLIFRREDMILDSIRHIPSSVSSVREVLPGRTYFIPGSERFELTGAVEKAWEERLGADPSKTVGKWIYSSFNGISPILSQDLSYRAGIDADRPTGTLKAEEKARLMHEIGELRRKILDRRFTPELVFQNGEPVEFGVTDYAIYADGEAGISKKQYDSVSGLLHDYYDEKSRVSVVRQKSSDLRKIVSNHVERCAKKLDMQQKQLKDTEKREKYRICGELLHTYGYLAKEGAKAITVTNYYDDSEMTIPLDPQLSAMENAKKYFDRYGKLKRTFEALTEFVKETEEELSYLQSVQVALSMARSEEDLNEIRKELVQSGYMKKKTDRKKERFQSRPLHYISADGFHIYVGKNNLQNEAITFSLAEGGDWWFHAKQMPGSHVIVKCKGKELPDKTFEEAAALAAHYSKGREAKKVEIDYVQRKHVKKPAGAKPGFVVYYTNYSMVASTDISGIDEIKE